jgi:HlyD family secretion protein
MSTYNTLINVNNSSLKLKPGMTANTSISVAKAENVLKVPNASLRYTPSEILKGETDKKLLTDRKFARKTSSHIWVLDNGKLRQVSVKFGIGDDSYTEILEAETKKAWKLHR